MEEVLAAEGITKKYPGVVANSNISITLREGEIHTLVGENGAGKTTLCRILYGETKPDAGEIRVFGEKAIFRSPSDALRFKIGMVHQHFRLIPAFTVAENVVLGLESPKRVMGVEVLDRQSFDRRILALSERFGLRVDPSAKVDQLSAGEKQRVELLKALYRDVRILILDEPTSVLTPKEVIDLFSTLKSMVEHGLSIIFTTHKLDEAMKVSDRITVLRNGQVVAERKPTETSPRELTNLMIGRDVPFEFKKGKGRLGVEILRAENISVTDDKGFTILKDFSLELREGEILGIAGVAGNGQRELAEALTGCRKIDAGRLMIRLDRETPFVDATKWSANQIIKSGVAHITDEPLRTGVVSDFTVAENLALKGVDGFSRAIGILDAERMRKKATGLIDEFSIKTWGPQQLTRDLSGGNIQRLVVARELSFSPMRILVASNPTKGVDVALTQFIRSKLLALREKGVAVLLISEDLEEILSLSDRIAVIFNGRLMGIQDAENVDVERVGLMMAGIAGEADGGGKEAELSS